MNKEYIEATMEPLSEAILQLPWQNPRFYAEYLAQSYYYVFHSCKMLAMCAGLTSKDQADLYRRSIAHIKEEAGHEVLALTDLKRLGFRIEDFPEDGITRALYEPQYYKILKQPTALLGYILALEYICFLKYSELHKLLSKSYEDKCLNFVRVHAEEDPDHVEKAVEQISKLSASELEAVRLNFEQTCDMFLTFLKRCESRATPHFLDRHKPSQAALLV